MGGRRGRWRKEPWRDRGQGEGQWGEKGGGRGAGEGSADPGNRPGQRATGEQDRRRDQVGEAKPPRARPEGERQNGARRREGEERGQMVARSLGSGSKRGREAGGAGSQTELPKRRRRWRREWRPSGERDRERELERAEGRPWGRERGEGGGWVPAGPTCSATSRTDWTLVP